MNVTEDFDDNESRRAFLLTYSQADLSRFNNCKRFAECVLAALNEGKSNKSVLEWACCMEDHADGVGKHFHMAVKLNGTRRWRPVKNKIYERHGISVNFATENCGYVAAYRYVCKNKPINEVLHSPDHTNMENIRSPKNKTSDENIYS